MRDTTAVQKGHDFRHAGVRYQVKANRPSGKPGSKVTLVAKAMNYDWDKLINERFEIQEAWIWDVADYKAAFDAKTRLSPKDYRAGMRVMPRHDGLKYEEAA